MSKISAVTVCVDYDDFLCLTLESYVSTFDEVVVVTEAADVKTIELCGHHGARVVLSDAKHDKDEAFNLPALLNDGFQSLGDADWLCKIDPDIYIPSLQLHEIRKVLDDTEIIWGAHRYFCASKSDLQEFESSGDYSILEPPYETGSDVLGFFQLFHSKSRHLGSASRPYEQEYFIGPSRTNDRIFCEQWPVENRKWMPFEVIHLGLEAIGANWKGRKSPPFV